MAFLALTAGQTDADSPLDQTLFDLIRTNFDDHESRIGSNEALSDAAIRDDFVYPAASGVDTDIWDVGSGSGTQNTDQQPNHVVRFDHDAGAAQFSVIAASGKKMRIDLDRDHDVVFQCRTRSVQSDNTEEWFFGLKDQSLTTATNACIATNDNVIGFRQGATANTYRAICAKAAASFTLQDNIGNAAAYTVLKITVVSTGSGAAITVRMYVDGVEVSNSPFTTLANIPVVSLRPVLGTYTGGGGNRRHDVDYVLAYWNARPLST